MKRTLIVTFCLALLLAATSVSAAQNKIFSAYEDVRQALIAGSIEDIQRTAAGLASVATSEKQKGVAARATALASIADLRGARDSFAMLSDEVIRFREGRGGRGTVVVYCSMEKKLWLQPKGAISNPYGDASMRACGEVQKDVVPAPPSNNHPGHSH